jgi:threonine/homoserine/homoserine lactone efflux protein
MLLFNVVKIVGAAYLVVLGLRALRNRRRLAEVLGAPVEALSTRRIVREGFVVGLTNPKTVIFFAAILPQFTDPSAGRLPLQLLTLGLVFVAIALVSDSTWGIAAGTAREWLGRSPRRLAALGGTGGLVMIGLGLSVAVTGRRE